MRPIHITIESPRFYSSVTDTVEFGHRYIDPEFFDPPEHGWARAYRSLRPFMTCKTLYYEATAVFFREKHFILGSSTYAHAWLRRIGKRNQVHLRNIRLKIHEEYTSTGYLNTSGSHWIEVLRKLGRSARDLESLGFQFDEDVDMWRSPLLEAFLRMRSFQKLTRIDFFYCFLPPAMDCRDFMVMTAESTGCALVRCLELNELDEGGHRLIRKVIRDVHGRTFVLPPVSP